MYAENCCRFRGILKSLEVKAVGDEGYILGKGTLFLPDAQIPFVGQTIKFTVWGDTAERMREFPNGTWMHVLSSYMPSVFRGELQDYFNVTSFQAYE